MDSLLFDIARSVANASTAEELTRNLFSILGPVSGLDSFFLSAVDAEQATFEILFTRNAQPEAIDIPEGLQLPWQDTVCRHALADGVRFTHAAQDLWPQVRVVHDLKISTYVIEPVRDVAGNLLGTLCGASDRHLPVDERLLPVLTMCARLIAVQLGRDKQRRAEVVRLAASRAPGPAALASDTDPLTGLASRPALLAELGHALTQATRDGSRVCVAYLNFDGFGAINRQHGSEVGDRFLVEMARRLRDALREHEFLARFGGDEFVVVSPLARHAAPEAPDRLSARLAAVTRGAVPLGEGEPAPALEHAGASVGTALSEVGDTARALLHRADEAMYEVKQRRAGRREAAPGLEADTDNGTVGLGPGTAASA